MEAQDHDDIADKMPSLVDDGSSSPPSSPPITNLEKSLDKIVANKKPAVSRIRTAIGKWPLNKLKLDSWTFSTIINFLITVLDTRVPKTGNRMYGETKDDSDDSDDDDDDDLDDEFLDGDSLLNDDSEDDSELPHSDTQNKLNDDKSDDTF